MYLQQFLIVAGVHLLAVMSPGPDFVMITRNSLVYSRRTGVLCAIGLGLGIMVHVTLGQLGLSNIFSRSVVAYNVLKYIGCAYLIYMGIRALRSKKPSEEAETNLAQQSDISGAAAVRIGFLTNVTNPKAALFFLALFTQVIDPATPRVVQIGYGAEMVCVTALWFSLVALVFSHSKVKQQFSRFGHWLDRAFGAIMVALGLRVAFSTQK